MVGGVKQRKTSKPAELANTQQAAAAKPAKAPKATQAAPKPAAQQATQGAFEGRTGQLSLRDMPGQAAPTTTGSGSPMAVRTGQVDVVSQRREAPVASVIPFSDDHPEVTAFANARGWNQPGYKTHVHDADLVFTTDNWQTTRTAKLQYFQDGSRGFLLPDVAPGKKVEFAVHAFVANTYNNMRFTADRGDVWVNNGGRNHVQESNKPFVWTPPQ